MIGPKNVAGRATVQLFEPIAHRKIGDGQFNFFESTYLSLKIFSLLQYDSDDSVHVSEKLFFFGPGNRLSPSRAVGRTMTSAFCAAAGAAAIAAAVGGAGAPVSRRLDLGSTPGAE